MLEFYGFLLALCSAVVGVALVIWIRNGTCNRSEWSEDLESTNIWSWERLFNRYPIEATGVIRTANTGLVFDRNQPTSVVDAPPSYDECIAYAKPPPYPYQSQLSSSTPPDYLKHIIFEKKWVRENASVGGNVQKNINISRILK